MSTAISYVVAVGAVLAFVFALTAVPIGYAERTLVKVEVLNR